MNVSRTLRTGRRQHSKRTLRSLRIEPLETRALMATFPLADGEIVNTFMQFQGVASKNDRTLIEKLHLHEGLDIAPQTHMHGQEVLSIQRGIVVAAYTPGKGEGRPASDSFVVIVDLNQNQELNTGWNYKHVIPRQATPQKNALQVGDTVEEGDVIGTVAPFPGQIPHLHLDRGDRPARIGPRGATEPYDASLGEYIDWLITTPPINNNQGFAEALARQLRPIRNPLVELHERRAKGLPADAVPPEIRSLDFRVAADDQNKLSNPGLQVRPFNHHAAKVSTTSRYFEGNLQIGDENFNQIGRLATEDGRKDITSENWAQIDFVARIEDRVGTPDNKSRYALSPKRLGFTIKRETPVTWPLPPLENRSIRDEILRTHEFVSFDFTGRLNEVGGYFNRNDTLAVYSLDKRNQSVYLGTLDSGAIGNDPRFILTNSRNVYEVDVVGGQYFRPGFRDAGNRIEPPTQTLGLPHKDRQLFWNSLAKTGSLRFPSSQAAASRQAVNATNNAEAEYPDGKYTITVWAEDAYGNRGQRKFPVVLTNWVRSIEFKNPVATPKIATPANAYPTAVQKTVVTQGGKLEIAGGKGYMAQQTLNAYLMPIIDPNSPPDMALNFPLKLGELATDKEGKITAASLTLKADAVGVGKYLLLVDYDGDGTYTQYLDAYAEVEVKAAPKDVAPPLPAKNPTAWKASGTSISTNRWQSVLGQEVIVTASVTNLTANAGQPTGWVSFFDHVGYLGQAPLDVAGTATFVTTDLRLGERTVTAFYTGDATFQGSVGTTNHWVTSSEVIEVLPPYDHEIEEWSDITQEEYDWSGDPPFDAYDDELAKYDDEFAWSDDPWDESQKVGADEMNFAFPPGPGGFDWSAPGAWRLPGLDDCDRVIEHPVMEQSANSYIDPWPETRSGLQPWYDIEYLLNLSESEARLESSNHDAVLADIIEDELWPSELSNDPFIMMMRGLLASK